MIPVRVPVALDVSLATDRRLALDSGHPLKGTECPACGNELEAGQVLVLVFAGIAPENRKTAGWVTGGAVAVHEKCALA